MFQFGLAKCNQVVIVIALLHPCTLAWKSYDVKYSVKIDSDTDACHLRYNKESL